MVNPVSKLGLVGLTLLFCGAGLGQNLTVEPVEVRLPTFVKSKDGSLVKNLSANDFEVFEGDVKLNVELEGKLDSPATIGIVLDLSGSVTTKTVEETVDRITSFVEAAPVRSEFFLCLVWRNEVVDIETTTDRKRIFAYLNEIRIYKPSGNTRLFDGVRRSIDRFGVALFRKQVLVIISDGNDNSSKTRGVDLLNVTQPGSVVTYTVNIVESGDSRLSYAQSGQGFLIRLTESGGGRSFAGSDRVFQVEPTDRFWPKEVSDDITNMYVLKTTLRPTLNRPKWRKLDVRLTKAARDRYGAVKLKARRGFYL